MNLDVEARVLAVEKQGHAFQDVELEAFDVELYEVRFRCTARDKVIERIDPDVNGLDVLLVANLIGNARLDRAARGFVGRKDQ